jgi:hypothetical protein
MVRHRKARARTGYLIKVTDTGSLRGYNTRVQGLKPYFYMRFWNTWLK